MATVDTTTPMPTTATMDLLTKFHSDLAASGVSLNGVPPDAQKQAFALYAANVKAALDRQKEAERTEVPFPQPGKALVANNLTAPEQGYGPSGTIFTGGVPYKPNYGAQDMAAAGMLLGNVLEAYRRNRKAAVDAQPEQP